MSNKKNFHSFRNTKNWDLVAVAETVGMSKGEFIRTAIIEFAQRNHIDLRPGYDED